MSGPLILMERGAASVCSIFKWFLEAISRIALLETTLLETQTAQAARTHLLSHRVFPDADFPIDGNTVFP